MTTEAPTAQAASEAGSRFAKAVRDDIHNAGCWSRDFILEVVEKHLPKLNGEDLSSDERAELERLRKGDFTKEEIHNFCHNLHGKVSLREFAQGCKQEMIKLYGSCPWMAYDPNDVARQRLEQRVKELESQHTAALEAKQKAEQFLANTAASLKNALCSCEHWKQRAEQAEATAKAVQVIEGDGVTPIDGNYWIEDPSGKVALCSTSGNTGRGYRYIKSEPPVFPPRKPAAPPKPPKWLRCRTKSDPTKREWWGYESRKKIIREDGTFYSKSDVEILSESEAGK